MNGREEREGKDDEGRKNNWQEDRKFSYERCGIVEVQKEKKSSLKTEMWNERKGKSKEMEDRVRRKLKTNVSVHTRTLVQCI